MRLRGTVLMRQGEVDAGPRASSSKVMALRPNAVSLYTDMGAALYDASRFPEALEAFEKAIALSPGSSISLTRAGVTAHAMGDTEARA